MVRVLVLHGRQVTLQIVPFASDAAGAALRALFSNPLQLFARRNDLHPPRTTLPRHRELQERSDARWAGSDGLASLCDAHGSRVGLDGS